MILDGKKVRDILAIGITAELKKLKAKPALAIIQIGDNEKSEVYIRQKKLFGEKLGFEVLHVKFEKNISEDVLLSEIHKLNLNKKIHGIIVQLPIVKSIDRIKVLENIAPEKDVDGMHSKNLRLLLENKKDGFVPATTKGILSLLDYYQIALESKKVCIIGRSVLVGKPTALAMMNREATVTICHSKTKNLKDEVKKADMVVVAVGNPEFIKKDFVKKGQIIVDVGITRAEDRIIGDVDFNQVSGIVKAITPVPGGVGPMTVVSLFENLLIAYKKQADSVKKV